MTGHSLLRHTGQELIKRVFIRSNKNLRGLKYEIDTKTLHLMSKERSGRGQAVWRGPLALHVLLAPAVGEHRPQRGVPRRTPGLPWACRLLKRPEPLPHAADRGSSRALLSPTSVPVPEKEAFL